MTPKPVMLENVDLDAIKAAAQDLIDTAWGDDLDEARRLMLSDQDSQYIFEEVMAALFGEDIFDKHYAPKAEELDDGTGYL